ncbi:MAG: tetratricopeptide repeat protein, partial [Planctomycetes bacterium]|nr:tetratricopeptide repeat protein [Planctomycetota bacterium]
MAYPHRGQVIRLAVLFSCLISAGTVWAAGDWEWTKDQGWVMGAGVARPTPREQLQYAYDLEQRGEFLDSARQYFLLVQNFPASDEAGVGLQRLARCLFEMENYYTSYEAIEQVIKSYPNTGRMSDLVEIELRIAKKLMVSQSTSILAGNEANARDFNIRRALTIVDSVIEHDPYGRVAAEAYLVKGEGHLFLNEVQQAREAFEKIRDEFPRSDFLERARLGIVTCDSLIGQASPQELAEAMELVREAERNRESEGDYDDVEDTIRKLSEVEAAKMLDQAEQYRIMGLPRTIKSSQFLYNELIRRYPNTPQAEIAMERLGQTRMPREEGTVTKFFKNLTLNPFVLTKDPAPPWIVPQMSAEDFVMVDHGIGPIAGVPETGMGPPRTMYSASVTPAALPMEEPELEMAAAPGNFSPVEAAPSAAPSFIDGMPPPVTSAGPQSEYRPLIAGGPQPVPAPAPLLVSNPIPGTEADLIGAPVSVYQEYFPASNPAPIPDFGAASNYPPASYYPPVAATPVAQPSPPSLGSPLWNTPDSDLVGPAPRPNTYVSPPIPEFGGAAFDPYPAPSAPP